MYVKLVNGELIEAPEKLELEDGTVLMEFNRSIDLMTQHGFKPLVDTKPNHSVDTQYCNFVEYYDTGRYIRCRWEIEDIELSEAELQNREAQAAMQMLNMKRTKLCNLKNEIREEFYKIIDIVEAR